MRFRAVHKLMSYLLATAAVATLVTSGSLPVATIALLAVLAVLSWFVEPGTWMGQLLDRAGLVFNVVALAFFGLSLFQVIESFPEPELTPILNVVLFLLGYKLFHRRSNRDYLQIYILSFLLILAAAWLAQTIFFVVGFVAYVVLATWTLILFHLRREIEDNYLVKHLPESGSEKVTAARVLNSRRVVGRSFFVATGAMSLVVFLGAAVVFAVVPRIGIGFLSGTFRRRMNIVGFSDEVTLGHHGVISGDNQTVVLWVRLPSLEQITDESLLDRAIGGLYWRGTVYDTYQNGGWIRSRRPETGTLLEGPLPMRDGGQMFWVHSREAPVGRLQRRSEKFLAGLDEQEIHVVGLSHPVAFALDEPVAFRVPPPPTGAMVTVSVEPRFGSEVALQPRRNSAGGQHASLNQFSGARYLAYSRQTIGRLDMSKGRPIEDLLTEGQLASYLSTPPSLSPRVGELARKITEGKPGPMAKAMAIVDWLQKTHRYTTDLKRDLTVPDPLEDFLFHQNAGHCEYFASATSVLLRLAGIPSRYVNGFLGGEWNALGKYLTIRDNRAHSWAEAYLGPAGWVKIDATPAAGAGWQMSRLQQVVDSIEFFWSRWVIDYDVSRQIDIARRIGRGVGAARGPVDLGEVKQVLRMLGIALGVGLLGAAIIRRLRRRTVKLGRHGRAHRIRRSDPRIYKVYHQVLGRLGKRGWARAPAETPREFAARVAAGAVPGATALHELTEHYAAARFGEREIPDGTITALEEALVELTHAPPPMPLHPPPQGPGGSPGTSTGAARATSSSPPS